MELLPRVVLVVVLYRSGQKPIDLLTVARCHHFPQAARGPGWIVGSKFLQTFFRPDNANKEKNTQVFTSNLAST